MAKLRHLVLLVALAGLLLLALSACRSTATRDFHWLIWVDPEDEDLRYFTNEKPVFSGDGNWVCAVRVLVKLRGTDDALGSVRIAREEGKLFVYQDVFPVESDPEPLRRVAGWEEAGRYEGACHE